MVASVLAVLGVMVSPLLVIFLGWLSFCAWTQRRLPADEAVKIIEAAGKWFPMRLRSPGADSQVQSQIDQRRIDRAA